ncbi:ATP-binding cassette domain-containing protein [Anaerocolumna sedimenticola]|uniref:ATP-binding cassette domain-containing protein n=1 Tax=Anaerocolumna sedimenticola TaxID=2696063 RepID=A0A6P1TN05_9FIRM|nr:ABC transporter ATP-binding protein [Anaerocolumna sedimenticola]QHQ61569.1 ATP-binding cassette domain-containing protein [Anaerocolumna sedimenticola]
MQLKVQNLHVSIDKKEIVKDVSLLVRNRQFVGIIGANGCGKSTMLKSIYKCLKPKEGSVFLDDIDLLKTPSKKVSQKMSVVGQFNELNFDLTVFQMVMLGRTPHKKLLESDTKEDIDIVHGAIKQTNLTEYIDRSYLTLSGGEKQRVILARAIAQQPAFLVLDEPTNHLDIRYQLEVLSCVKKLNIGVLAALHDLQMAAEYCDYIYAMKKGKIIAHGQPKELFTEELVAALYDVNCKIYENPITHNLSFVYQI